MVELPVLPAAGAVLLALSPLACTRGEERAPAAPPVELEPEILSLPLIPFGGSGRGEFHLRNRSDQDVVITGIGPIACDCNVVDLTLPDRPAPERHPSAEERGMRLAVHPGEELLIGIELDTSRYREPVSWKTGRIPLHIEGYDYLPLDYRADIWVPFWVEPWGLDLGRVGVRQRATGTVSVQGQEESDFQLLAPAEDDGWLIQVRKLHNSEQKVLYRVTVRAPPELPQGPFQHRFELATDLSGAPPVRFAVSGIAIPDLAHDPNRLLFRSTALAPQSVDLRLLAPDRSLPTPRIHLEGNGSSGYQAELKVVDEGHAWRVIVQPPTQPPPAGTFARLVIESEDPETPRIRVPLMFLPERKP